MVFFRLNIVEFRIYCKSTRTFFEVFPGENILMTLLFIFFLHSPDILVNIAVPTSHFIFFPFKASVYSFCIYIKIVNESETF